MEDIIATIPWTCDHSDGCEVGWHLANYWLYDDSTYSIDNYADGDHEPVDADDVPSCEEIESAWRQYHAHVALTGKDPLGQFTLPILGFHKRQWQARLRTWIGIGEYGPRVTGLRRRGRGEWITDCRLAPPVVTDYLCIDQKHRSMPDFKGSTEEAFAAVQLACVTKFRRVGQLELLIWFDVDEPRKPWSDERLSQYLKKRARAALKRQ